jgi:hypothetical protein
VGAGGGYQGGYHGFQGELDQGASKGTLAPPTINPLPPLYGHPPPPPKDLLPLLGGPPLP